MRSKASMSLKDKMSCRTQERYRKKNAICPKTTEKLLEANQQKGSHNANSIHTLVDKPDTMFTSNITETGTINMETSTF